MPHTTKQDFVKYVQMLLLHVKRDSVCGLFELLLRKKVTIVRILSLDLLH